MLLLPIAVFDEEDEEEDDEDGEDDDEEEKEEKGDNGEEKIGQEFDLQCTLNQGRSRVRVRILINACCSRL